MQSINFPEFSGFFCSLTRIVQSRREVLIWSTAFVDCSGLQKAFSSEIKKADDAFDKGFHSEFFR